jgi:lipopolysaccharide export system protein LptA
VKRNALIMAVAGWVMAVNFAMPMRNALAQDAASAPSAVVEAPPPSGEVTVPAASTISSRPPVAATPAARTRRVKAASIKSDSKDGSPDGSPFAGFENSTNHGPINIKSDTMSFDYKKSVVVFSGHVHAEQAGNELTTNILHVQMNKESQIQEMIADGNVRMSQGQRWATGDHAVLDQSAHTLVLTGSPVVHDGNDQIAGSKITVFLQSGKSEVTDPKAVIFPRESKRPNNNDTAADYAR